MHIDDRYSRQVLFKEIGVEGQNKLAQSRVVIVGCGATGSALASLLARSGIGTLRILDRDYVESSNLQRQALFDEEDARESLPKAIAAARQIARFNSQDRRRAPRRRPDPGECRFPARRLRSDSGWHRQFRNPLPDQRLCGEKFRGLDLRRRGRQLCRDHEHPSRRNRVPGLHLSRIPARHGGDLRDRRHFEFCRQPGGVDCGNRGVEVSGGCPGENAADAAFLGCLDERTGGVGGDASAGGMPSLLAETSFTWRGKDGRTLRCAAEIRCRSTSGSGRWILPSSAPAFSLTATFATTSLC